MLVASHQYKGVQGYWVGVQDGRMLAENRGWPSYPECLPQDSPEKSPAFVAAVLNVVC